MKVSGTAVMIAGGLLVAAYVVFKKKDLGTAAVDAAAGVGETIGQGAVAAGSGVVLGIGDGIGVPRTNMTECERAKAEGRTWDASFACPAGDFLSYVFN